ncbi:hypothetical protein BDSB_09350 [Burkholderia dolosa PC543]|nr:hypothetical protein BDSB_09350 [Burkholderia dolosa PC543]
MTRRSVVGGSAAARATGERPSSRERHAHRDARAFTAHLPKPIR